MESSSNVSNINGAMNKINNRIKATLQQQNYDPSQPSETTATMRVCVRACVNVCVCVCVCVWWGTGGLQVGGWSGVERGEFILCQNNL